LRPAPGPPLFPYTTLFRSRHHHGEVLDSALRESLDGLRRIGREPFGDPEARLKREHELVLIEAKPLANEPRGLHALAMIRIAFRSEEHTSELQSPYDLVCR